jgi:hypothetical protein
MSGLGKGLMAISRSPLGYIWNLPNTALGLIWGGVGLISQIAIFPFTRHWEFYVSVANNTINFDGHPLMFFGAITIGNTSSFIPDSQLPEGYRNFDGTRHFGASNTGLDHEMYHSYDGQKWGLLYLPANITGGVISILSSDSASRYPGRGNWHRNNFMEFGAISHEQH